MVSSRIVPTRFNNAVEASSQILTQEPTNDMHLLSEIIQIMQPFNSNRNNQNVHFLVQIELLEKKMRNRIFFLSKMLPNLLLFVVQT